MFALCSDFVVIVFFVIVYKLTIPIVIIYPKPFNFDWFEKDNIPIIMDVSLPFLLLFTPSSLNKQFIIRKGVALLVQI